MEEGGGGDEVCVTWCMAEVGQKGSEEIIWGDTTVDKGHLVLGFFCFFLKGVLRGVV